MFIEILQGKWLKHPLHPIFAHVPVGLWPAALVFDLISQGDGGRNVFVRLSFFCIVLGLITSALAVPTGIVDWLEIKREKPAWKLGLYHMGINVIVIVVCAANIGLRVSTFRQAPNVAAAPLTLSALAVVLLAISTYLGGRMIYDQGISVARFSKGKLRRTAQSHGANLAPEKGGKE